MSTAIQICDVCHSVHKHGEKCVVCILSVAMCKALKIKVLVPKEKKEKKNEH